ncbi:uncharacterized protein LOC141903794 [Tubulanus polymorphus]|uniref:uncharacterized protein LOC141903794 n=1 Tax=Tubulanus polymorphus TaxID=672921 RepID=UPI003DA48D1F
MKLLQIYIAIGSTILAGVIAFIWFKYTLQKHENRTQQEITTKDATAEKKTKKRKNKDVADDAEKNDESGSIIESESKLENSTSDSVKPDIDPFEYVEHLQGEVKKIHQKVATKKIMENLTSEQIEEERETQRRQLKEIFELMKSTGCEENGGGYGVSSFEEMQQQMKLYA